MSRKSTHEDLVAASHAVEKEMNVVKALKRLSLGNSLNYDPDLPPAEADFVDLNYIDVHHRNSTSSAKSSSSRSSLRSSIQSSIRSSGSSYLAPHRSSFLAFEQTGEYEGSAGDSAETETLKESDQHHVSSPTRSFTNEQGTTTTSSSDSEYDAENVIMDSSKLMWVPAAAHPKLAPENFRKYVQETVNEITTKLDRKRSKRSSLALNTGGSIGSSSSSSGSSRDQHKSIKEARTNSVKSTTSTASIPATVGSPTRRKPSLKELTTELENLSHLAGMDSTDAATLARTLSSSSLGLTEMEKEVYGDAGLSSLSRSAPNSPTVASDEDLPIPVPEGNGLKRSRWTTYRKSGGPRPYRKLQEKQQQEHERQVAKEKLLQESRPPLSPQHRHMHGSLHKQLPKTPTSKLPPLPVQPQSPKRAQLQSPLPPLPQSHHEQVQAQGQGSYSQNYQGQGQPQGYPQGQPQGQGQNYQGQPQGYPQGQVQGYPQGQGQGYPQGQVQGQVQGQPQGYPQNYQGQPQSYQGQPQGYPQSQNYPQNYPQGQPQGQPQSQPQSYPQSYPQGQPQSYPQGQPLPLARTPPLNQSQTMGTVPQLSSQRSPNRHTHAASAGAPPLSSTPPPTPPTSATSSHSSQSSSSQRSQQPSPTSAKKSGWSWFKTQGKSRSHSKSSPEQPAEFSPSTSSDKEVDAAVAAAAAAADREKRAPLANIFRFRSRSVDKGTAAPAVSEEDSSGPLKAVFGHHHQKEGSESEVQPHSPNQFHFQPQQQPQQSQELQFQAQPRRSREERPDRVEDSASAGHHAPQAQPPLQSRPSRHHHHRRTAQKPFDQRRVDEVQAERERMERERVERERLERERIEKERVEKERVEKERAEKERLEKERAEKERAEKERIEKEKAAKTAKEAHEPVAMKVSASTEALKQSLQLAHRNAKPNQPLEMRDSAFGFPLPPVSKSTLVMLDYRFPIHVERAVYRLSHLKLADPKRPLYQQVLLSNFMYAYLNLVNHTLYLQQQQQETQEVAEETAVQTEGNTAGQASQGLANGFMADQMDGQMAEQDYTQQQGTYDGRRYGDYQDDFGGDYDESVHIEEMYGGDAMELGR